MDTWLSGGEVTTLTPRGNHVVTTWRGNHGHVVAKGVAGYLGDRATRGRFRNFRWSTKLHEFAGSH